MKIASFINKGDIGCGGSPEAGDYRIGNASICAGSGEGGVDMGAYGVACYCGDVNGSGAITTGDAFMLLNYFGSGPIPVTCWQVDINGDGELTTGDGFELL